MTPSDDVTDEFILVQDDSSHWYVIPADKEPHWDQWCGLDGDDPRAWEPPPYAEEVGGSPRLVRFKQFTIA